MPQVNDWLSLIRHPFLRMACPLKDVCLRRSPADVALVGPTGAGKQPLSTKPAFLDVTNALSPERWHRWAGSQHEEPAEQSGSCLGSFMSARL